MALTPSTTGYAPVNGLRLCYETHGTGRPLILLHGSLGATGMFAPILPALSEGRQVVAIDLQAHGRTADIDRPLSQERMADDVAALIRHLGLPGADVMGYSMGGGVAMRTAIQHPDLVRRLIVVSFACRSDGWYPEILTGMRQMTADSAEPMQQTPMYATYAEVAPRQEDWPVLLGKLGDMLRRDYDWSAEVARITTPSLIALGDADAVRTSHGVEIFELLGGGQRDGGWDGSGRSSARLAILPGLTHYDIFASPVLVSMVISFLDDVVT
jgi:pimeloyl-ACP methyl ester carboxylesterase